MVTFTTIIWNKSWVHFHVFEDKYQRRTLNSNCLLSFLTISLWNMSLSSFLTSDWSRKEMVIKWESLDSLIPSQIVLELEYTNWAQLFIFNVEDSPGTYFLSALYSTEMISPPIAMTWNIFLVSVSWHANIPTVSQAKTH